MRTTYTLLRVAAVLILSVAPADAALWKFNVFIDGLQESPPVPTPGNGTAMVLFDDVTGMMDVDGSFSSLIGTSTVAHIHGYAALGDPPAGVVFGLTLDPVGGTSGLVYGSGTIPSADIQKVLDGLSYINIHSSFRPGGEIRGQLLEPMFIPEPASVALLAIGLTGLISLRRWSRRLA